MTMVNFTLSTHVWDWGSLWPGSAIFERHPTKMKQVRKWLIHFLFCRWMVLTHAFQLNLSLKQRHGRRWSTSCNHGCRKLLLMSSLWDLQSWSWSNTLCSAWGSCWKWSDWLWRRWWGSIVILRRPPGCKWTETDFWLVFLPVLAYFS